MQLCRSPPHGHVGNFADQTATNLSLAPAMVTKIIKRDHAAFQRGVLVDEALTDHRDTILVQHAKRVKIWAREGRLGQVEVFLQMCCLSTSIIERPRHFYAINTPKSKTRSTPLITKSPYLGKCFRSILPYPECVYESPDHYKEIQPGEIINPPGRNSRNCLIILKTGP